MKEVVGTVTLVAGLVLFVAAFSLFGHDRHVFAIVTLVSAAATLFYAWRSLLAPPSAEQEP